MYTYCNISPAKLLQVNVNLLWCILRLNQRRFHRKKHKAKNNVQTNLFNGSVIFSIITTLQLNLVYIGNKLSQTKN